MRIPKFVSPGFRSLFPALTVIVKKGMFEHGNEGLDIQAHVVSDLSSITWSPLITRMRAFRNDFKSRLGNMFWLDVNPVRVSLCSLASRRSVNHDFATVFLAS